MVNVLYRRIYAQCMYARQDCAFVASHLRPGKHTLLVTTKHNSEVYLTTWHGKYTKAYSYKVTMQQS